MFASPYMMCLWPGLPRLWLRGDWSALVIAVAFGGVLNLVLASSFVWPELLPPSLNVIAWIIVGIVWSGSAVLGYRSLPDLREPPPVDDQGLFIQAQAEYLKGHWFEAETILRKLLRNCHRDADAQLMLATLYRHTRRFDEAAKQLDRIDRLDEAVKWRWEIEKERAMLQRIAAAELGSENGTTQARRELPMGGTATEDLKSNKRTI